MLAPLLIDLVRNGTVDPAELLTRQQPLMDAVERTRSSIGVAPDGARSSCSRRPTEAIRPQRQVRHCGYGLRLYTPRGAL
jgi:hypothetical protein